MPVPAVSKVSTTVSLAPGASKTIVTSLSSLNSQVCKKGHSAVVTLFCPYTAVGSVPYFDKVGAPTRPLSLSLLASSTYTAAVLETANVPTKLSRHKPPSLHVSGHTEVVRRVP